MCSRCWKSVEWKILPHPNMSHIDLCSEGHLSWFNPPNLITAGTTVKAYLIIRCSVFYDVNIGHIMAQAEEYEETNDDGRICPLLSPEASCAKTSHKTQT